MVDMAFLHRISGSDIPRMETPLAPTAPGTAGALRNIRYDTWPIFSLLTGEHQVWIAITGTF
ncbi:hypothetical protein H3V53_28800 [Paraburkholderia bengalensis]|uniref:Uncharacterized protein n=1 Tax=Paraburkholderia bengalensis TaxID=2747562 RepID=A0ABU8IZV2_9BURK